jgi:hypothetical protein
MLPAGAVRDGSRAASDRVCLLAASSRAKLRRGLRPGRLPADGHPTKGASCGRT